MNILNENIEQYYSSINPNQSHLYDISNENCLRKITDNGKSVSVKELQLTTVFNPYELIKKIKNSLFYLNLVHYLKKQRKVISEKDNLNKILGSEVYSTISVDIYMNYSALSNYIDTFKDLLKYKLKVEEVVINVSDVKDSNFTLCINILHYENADTSTYIPETKSLLNSFIKDHLRKDKITQTFHSESISTSPIKEKKKDQQQILYENSYNCFKSIYKYLQVLKQITNTIADTNKTNTFDNSISKMMLYNQSFSSSKEKQNLHVKYKFNKINDIDKANKNHIYRIYTFKDNSIKEGIQLSEIKNVITILNTKTKDIEHIDKKKTLKSVKYKYIETDLRQISFFTLQQYLLKNRIDLKSFINNDYKYIENNEFHDISLEDFYHLLLPSIPNYKNIDKLLIPPTSSKFRKFKISKNKIGILDNKVSKYCTNNIDTPILSYKGPYQNNDSIKDRDDVVEYSDDSDIDEISDSSSDSGSSGSSGSDSSGSGSSSSSGSDSSSSDSD